MSSKGIRGRPATVTDEKLKELALNLKYKNGESKLSYLFLEKETGIGRNTWRRRIGDYISQLNSPVSRSFDISDKDNVYLPNIGQIYEAFGKDPIRFKQELLTLQSYYDTLYLDYEKLKKEVNKLKSYKEQLVEKDEKIKELKKSEYHYKQLYEEYLLASTEPHLRKEKDIKENLIDFKKSIDGNGDLSGLPAFFPDISQEKIARLEEKDEHEKVQKNMDIIMGVFKKD
jgi:hypothetical protein